MSFNLKTSSTTSTNRTLWSVRAELVQAAYVDLAQQIVDDADMTEDMACKVMKPLQDMIHRGERPEGHADQVQALVAQNLSAALDYVKQSQEVAAAKTAKSA